MPRVKKQTVEAEAEVAQPKVAANGNGGEADGPSFPVLTTAQVTPKAFQSRLIALGDIDGWEDIGDYPTESFVDDVRANGLEVPIVVEAVGDRYVVVEGRRRLKTFNMLHAEGANGFSSIPAVINPRKTQRDLKLRSLSMNYKRGENVTGDARTVKDLMEQGYTEQTIAAASGTPLETVRALRDIGQKLHPRLFKAVEQDKMKPWSAKHASRLGPAGTARLLAILDQNGRITSDEVIEARKFNVVQSLENDLPSSLFDDKGELPYDDAELESSADLINEEQGFELTGGDEPRELATPEKKTRQSKVTKEDRLNNIVQLLTMDTVNTLDVERKHLIVEDVVYRLQQDYRQARDEADTAAANVLRWVAVRNETNAEQARKRLREADFLATVIDAAIMAALNLDPR